MGLQQIQLDQLNTWLSSMEQKIAAQGGLGCSLEEVEEQLKQLQVDSLETLFGNAEMYPSFIHIFSM